MDQQCKQNSVKNLETKNKNNFYAGHQLSFIQGQYNKIFLSDTEL